MTTPSLDVVRLSYHVSQLIIASVVETGLSGPNTSETSTFLTEIDNRILDIDSEAEEIVDSAEAVGFGSAAIPARATLGQIQKIRALRSSLFGTFDGSQTGALQALRSALLAEAL
jgi:hypothetical protein